MTGRCPVGSFAAMCCVNCCGGLMWKCMLLLSLGGLWLRYSCVGCHSSFAVVECAGMWSDALW